MASARDVAKALRDGIAKSIRDTMLLARQNVTNATPVDTGHAASNWVLSISRPYSEVCGSREAVSTSAQDVGDAAIREYSGGDLRSKIYLRNNVPYMVYLDNGWSQQAPLNFIARALSGTGVARNMPAGTRRAAKTMLRGLAQASIRRGGRQ